MFTVKHYRENGSRFVYSCDHYVFNPPHEPCTNNDTGNASISLFEKPTDPDAPQESKAVIGLFDGDSIYIENANGHTIDVIRPSRLV